MNRALLKERKKFLPKVSIIIPVYNGANYLSEAIDSALTQDYPNIEVLVVNDGSTDQGKTERIASLYGDKIRYFHKRNGGVASALNYGIKEMAGEYFSWLSHDDIYMSNKISKEIESLARLDDKKRMICCGYEVVDENRNFLYEINPVKEYGTDKLEIPLFPVFRCCINGCGLLIHRSHFERVGTFDEKLLTTQDYDLWFRILRGEQLHFIDDICFYSRSHEAQSSRQLFDTHIEECNTLWIRLFDSLTIDEKCWMDGTEYNFLCQEKKRFLQSDYYKVVDYLDKELLHLTKRQWETRGDKKAEIENTFEEENQLIYNVQVQKAIQKYAANKQRIVFLFQEKLCYERIRHELDNIINNSCFGYEWLAVLWDEKSDIYIEAQSGLDNIGVNIKNSYDLIRFLYLMDSSLCILINDRYGDWIKHFSGHDIKCILVNVESAPWPCNRNINDWYWADLVLWGQSYQSEIYYIRTVSEIGFILTSDLNLQFIEIIKNTINNTLGNYFSKRMNKHLHGEKYLADMISKITEAYEDEIFNLKVKNDNFKKINFELLKEKNEYKKQYEVIYNSTFWRITKPFRMFIDLLKGKHGKVW